MEKPMVVIIQLVLLVLLLLLFFHCQSSVQVFIPYVSVHEMMMRELASLVPGVVAASQDVQMTSTWDATPADKLGLPGETPQQSSTSLFASYSSGGHRIGGMCAYMSVQPPYR